MLTNLAMIAAVPFSSSRIEERKLQTSPRSAFSLLYLFSFLSTLGLPVVAASLCASSLVAHKGWDGDYANR